MCVIIDITYIECNHAPRRLWWLCSRRTSAGTFALGKVENSHISVEDAKALYSTIDKPVRDCPILSITKKRHDICPDCERVTGLVNAVFQTAANLSAGRVIYEQPVGDGEPEVKGPFFETAVFDLD